MTAWNTMRRRIVIPLCLVLSCLIMAHGVEAHAFPDHSDPTVGGTVTAPPMVRIWFDGALEPAFCQIRVEAAKGQRVDKGNGRVDPSDPFLLEAGLPQLPTGVYHVFWSVVSRDGHRTEGDYTFTVR